MSIYMFTTKGIYEIVDGDISNVIEAITEIYRREGIRYYVLIDSDVVNKYQMSEINSIVERYIEESQPLHMMFDEELERTGAHGMIAICNEEEISYSIKLIPFGLCRDIILETTRANCYSADIEIICSKIFSEVNETKLIIRCTTRIEEEIEVKFNINREYTHNRLLNRKSIEDLSDALREMIETIFNICPET